MEENWKAIIQNQEQIIKSQWKIIEDLEKRNKELMSSASQITPPQSSPQPSNNTQVKSNHPQVKSPPVAVAQKVPKLSRQIGFTMEVPPQSAEVEEATNSSQEANSPQETSNVEETPQDTPEPSAASGGAQPGPQDSSALNNAQIPKISEARGIDSEDVGGDWSNEEDGYTFYVDNKIALMKHDTEEIMYFFLDGRLAELLLQKLQLPGVSVRTVLRKKIDVTSTEHAIPAFLVEMEDGNISYTLII